MDNTTVYKQLNPDDMILNCHHQWYSSRHAELKLTKPSNWLRQILNCNSVYTNSITLSH
jgi:hypothetical protein